MATYRFEGCTTPDEETAAAIAVALALLLDMGTETERPATSSRWTLAGRLEAMGGPEPETALDRLKGWTS